MIVVVILTIDLHRKHLWLISERMLSRKGSTNQPSRCTQATRQDRSPSSSHNINNQARSAAWKLPTRSTGEGRWRKCVVCSPNKRDFQQKKIRPPNYPELLESTTRVPPAQDRLATLMLIKHKIQVYSLRRGTPEGKPTTRWPPCTPKTSFHFTADDLPTASLTYCILAGFRMCLRPHTTLRGV